MKSWAGMRTRSWCRLVIAEMVYSVKAEVFRDKSIDSSLIKVSSFELVIYVHNVFFEEINLWFIQLTISLLSSLT